jgi:cell division protein FtsA
MMDIIEKVDYEIELSAVRHKLGGGLVLTGGGSAMQNIAQLFTYHTGLEIHLGFPSQKLGKGMIEEVRNPMFSTGIGLVLKGFEIADKQDLPGNELKKKPEAKENPALVKEPVQKEKSSKLGNLFSGKWGPFKGFNDWMKDGEDFNED